MARYCAIEIDLLLQRHPGQSAQAKTLPEELAQGNGHVARRRRPRAGKRSDRVQAVEQEMRVDLGTQRAQFRFAGEHRRFERLPACRLLVLQCEEHVVHGRGEQEQQHTGREQQQRRVTRPERLRRQLGPQPPLREPHPRGARDRGRGPLREEHAPERPGALQRKGAADIPRRQAHHAVRQRQAARRP